jgi:hypothetical protein
MNLFSVAEEARGVARSRRTWKRIATRGATAAVSAAVLGWLAWLLGGGDLDRNDKIASVAGMLISLAGLVISAWALRVTIRQAPRGPVADVDEATRMARAVDLLAEAVTAQWRDEAGLRALHRPAPLRLTWASTTRPVAVPAHTIAGTTITGRVVRLRLHGDLSEVADKFLALPHRRLVVLGEPGAGKTVLAMLLTLELLKRLEPDQPVPVLLALSSWDPTTEHLHTWLARRLGEDYPALTSSTYGPAAPKRLITGGRILPVLDGLDEQPEPLRATAVRELDRARADQPLVVTCRGQEYQHAVAVGGGSLAAAAVVELQPVTAAEAITFLRTTAAPAAERWDRVAAHLHAAPNGALAAALSTPLMVTLARTIYTSPDRDPGELVDLVQAGGQATVERHLLDGFIPAAYTTPPPAPDTPAPRLPRPPSPELARRWLTLLATHLHQRHTSDLAWWQLPGLIPQRGRRLAVGLGVGLPAGLALAPALVLLSGRVDDFVYGLWFGLTFSVALGVALALGPSAPTQVNLRLRRRHGQRPQDPFGQLWSRRITFALKVALAAGLAAGLTIGLAVTLWLGFEAVRTDDPLELVLGLWLGPPAMLVGGLLFGLWYGAMIGLVFALMEWLRNPADDARAVTPWSVLRDDRTAAIVLGLMTGLVFGLPVTLLGGFESGLAWALVWGLTGGLGLTAWGQFTIVRAWLAARGQLPWRLMAFLDDAHHRGVLRQAGAVYQFRHARLQDNLADTSPTSHAGR